MFTYLGTVVQKNKHPFYTNPNPNPSMLLYSNKYNETLDAISFIINPSCLGTHTTTLLIPVPVLALSHPSTSLSMSDQIHSILVFLISVILIFHRVVTTTLTVGFGRTLGLLMLTR